MYDGCPWCDAVSKPKARLNFYDVLSEGDYKKGNQVGEKPKLVNSYVLRDGKNQIKSLYVLRYDDPGKEKRCAENYMTVAKNAEGYWAFNEFSKSGIEVFHYRTGTYEKVGDKRPIKLENGDSIFFNFNTVIEVSGKKYSFVRMARFMEETP